jgi:hypothetical protein
MTKVIEQGQFVIEVRHVVDDMPDLSYLDGDYSDCTRKERIKYQERDKERLEAYNRGDWHMMGVTVDVRIKTPANWAKPHMVGHAALWGIESDSDAAYIEEVERDLIEEALQDAKLTYESLQKSVKGND